MSKSKIEWTEQTWNPSSGCTKVSQGCKFCYAEVMTRRLKAMGKEKYKDGFAVRTHANALSEPLKRKKSATYFVNSMSDLFHEEIPLSFIKEVFQVMNDTPRHTYQVLTKRAERLVEVQSELNWTENIWMGVSVEDTSVIDRIDYLRETDAHIKFLSLEPLLGALPNLNLEGIDWVIVGGESGNNARPMKEEWVIDIKDQCEESEVAFFFKQWGTKNKKLAGRLLGGRTYDEMPKKWDEDNEHSKKKTINNMDNNNFYITELDSIESIFEHGIFAGWYGGIVIVDDLESAHFMALQFGFTEYAILQIDAQGVYGEWDYHLHDFRLLGSHHFLQQGHFEPKYISKVGVYSTNQINKPYLQEIRHYVLNPSMDNVLRDYQFNETLNSFKLNKAENIDTNYKMFYLTNLDRLESIFEQGICVDWYDGVLIVERLENVHYMALQYGFDRYAILEIDTLGVYGDGVYHPHDFISAGDHFIKMQDFFIPKYIRRVGVYSIGEFNDID